MKVYMDMSERKLLVPLLCPFDLYLDTIDISEPN